MMTAKTDDSPDLSSTVEDYLKAIYHIELGGGAASKVDVAQRMGVASASVSGMVGRLAQQGLVSHERYGPVTLTDAGRRAALRTIRRHRLIETYLTEVFGYPWDRVHEEAERLEHAASDELVDCMAAALGEPDVDPHGAPIPTREGMINETVHRTLDTLQAGERALVARIADHDSAVLRYLDELGLRPGTEVTVIDRAPFAGPITLDVAGAVRVIGPTLAAEIMVSSPTP